MQQELHVYYLNRLDPKPWHGTILVKYKNLTSPQELRDKRNDMPKALNGGYHLSYMGGKDRVIKKMRSIVDGNWFVENSKDNLTDVEHVEDVMEKGTDPYNRPGAIEAVPCNVEDIRLPNIKEFVQKYPYFIKN